MLQSSVGVSVQGAIKVRHKLLMGAIVYKSVDTKYIQLAQAVLLLTQVEKTLEMKKME